jgi:N-acetylglutamate synthase-like GNAT family acetyltransferase
MEKSTFRATPSLQSPALSLRGERAEPVEQDSAESATGRQPIATAVGVSCTYNIERALPTHIAAIRDLLAQVHFDTRDLEPARFVVAYAEGDRLIGCAQIKPIGNKMALSSVVVAPGYQSRGVGRGLIHALLRDSNEPIYLMCVGRLIPYYTAFGFQLTAARNAPWGLYWRWVALACLGIVSPDFARARIMVRFAPNM